ncbi:MAG: hypothetical protein AAGL66_17990, partial [Pseudomonadota bacterium]
DPIRSRMIAFTGILGLGLAALVNHHSASSSRVWIKSRHVSSATFRKLPLDAGGLMVIASMSGSGQALGGSAAHAGTPPRHSRFLTCYL